MHRLRMLLARLRGMIHDRRADQELDAEIAHHIAMETAQLLAQGHSPADAARRARVAFGAVEAIKEDHRDGRSFRWVEEFRADIRHAFRSLRRHPALGVAAIVTLAIGIGANTAIYSAVNAVILRPLPFTDPGRLVMLWEESAEKGWHRNVVAGANFLDWKEQTPAFQDAAAYFAYSNPVTMTGAGDPAVFSLYLSTGNFFSVLGVRTELGRSFLPEETLDNSHRVVMVSHHFWQEQLNSAPGVVGRTIQLNGHDWQIVGVLPESFRIPGVDADLWAPQSWNAVQRAQQSFRRAHSYRAVARLRPGVTLAQANAQLQVVVKRLQHDYPATNTGMGAGMTPLQEFLVGDVRQPLLVLFAAVGLLLLIACANVGNLMLVQAVGRGREAALRLALGARRGRLARQALAESLMLSLLGGGAGLLLGWWGAHALFALQPGMLPVDRIPMQWGVVGFVALITVGSGALFALAPILWTSGRVPGDALKEGGRGGGAGRPIRRWGRALVVVEVALALVLTTGAGLLVRSFTELTRVNPGFDPDNVLTIALNVPGSRYNDPNKVNAFYGQLLEQIDALPGVRSAALTSSLPLGGGVGWTSDFIAAGRAPDNYGTEVAHRSVSADYFHTMRVPVLQGRGFTPADGPNDARVVVVNSALARSYFRGQDPVGQRITFNKTPDSTSIWYTIVGVVGDERQSALSTDTQIEFITPDRQSPSEFMNVMIRTAPDPMTLVPAVRRAISGIDPLLAVSSVQTMNDVRDQSLAEARFLMTLLAAFAAAGLLLAIVGVYGVMSYVARGRTREMGIRLALGAGTSSVRWLVMREGLWLTTGGVGIGLAVAFVACRAMTALLYHVAPADLVTYLVVPPVLVVTALLATWVPAARASRADPMGALRDG